MTDVALHPIESRVEATDDLDHIVCCRDVNVSLCNLDVTNVEWATYGGDGPVCVVCDELWGLRLCPYGSHCR